MSQCIPARAVGIRLRHRTTGHRRECTVVCPLRWSRSRLLTHVRAEHPSESVVIVDWPQLGWDHIWLVNPDDIKAAA